MQNIQIFSYNNKSLDIAKRTTTTFKYESDEVVTSTWYGEFAFKREISKCVANKQWHKSKCS